MRPSPRVPRAPLPTNYLLRENEPTVTLTSARKHETPVELLPGFPTGDGHYMPFYKRWETLQAGAVLEVQGYKYYAKNFGYAVLPATTPTPPTNPNPTGIPGWQRMRDLTAGQSVVIGNIKAYGPDFNYKIAAVDK